jgi:hypothetical protein
LKGVWCLGLLIAAGKLFPESIISLYSQSSSGQYLFPLRTQSGCKLPIPLLQRFKDEAGHSSLDMRNTLIHLQINTALEGSWACHWYDLYLLFEENCASNA